MFCVGKFLRSLHDATKTFVLPIDAIWRQWHGRRIGNANCIGHCDTGPWNIVSRDGKPYALIDWEVAGPVDPIIELAQTCWLNAQLYSDDIAKKVGLASLAERAYHVKLILDGYELPKSKRNNFVDKMIEFAVHDAAVQAEEVTSNSKNITPLWGITWRTRSAAWMLTNHSTLENSIV